MAQIYLKEEIKIEPTTISYDEHIQSGIQQSPNFKWRCKLCHQSFHTRAVLRDHTRETHNASHCKQFANYSYNTQTQLYSCKMCKAEFKKRSLMWKHVLVHEEKFTCKICNEVQDSAYKFSLHLNKHAGDNNYKCPLCEYVTKITSSMSTHITSVHLKRFPYYCKHCGKGYHDAVMCTDHELKHLGKHSVPCIVCQKSFGYTRNLIHHQINCHKVPTTDASLNNQCNVCLKHYSSSSSLRKHKRIHEIDASDGKPNVCDWCGKVFKDNGALKQHERIHTGYKLHKCSYCEKVFSRTTYLRHHELTHSGEKPLSCEHCGKRFIQATSLKIHVRTHTGERPYKCHLCNKGYTSGTALKTHISRCSGLS